MTRKLKVGKCAFADLGHALVRLKACRYVSLQERRRGPHLCSSMTPRCGR